MDPPTYYTSFLINCFILQCCIVLLSFLGNAKSSNVSLNPLPKRNIVPCLLQAQKSYGFEDSLQILESISSLPHHFMLITPVQSKSPLILSSMNALNTLRSIATTFENFSSMVPLTHVSSHDQTADIFTKAMTRGRHSFLVGKLMRK